VRLIIVIIITELKGSSEIYFAHNKVFKPLLFLRVKVISGGDGE